MGRGPRARWGSKTTWRTPARPGLTKRRSARETWSGAAWSPTFPTSAANSSPPWPRSSGRGGYASGHTCIGALREREGSGCVLVSTWWIPLLVRLRRVARALHNLRVRIHHTKAPHCDGIECCIHYYESTRVDCVLLRSLRQ